MRRNRDIDIAKSPLSQWLRPRINWLWFLVFFAALFGYAVIGGMEWDAVLILVILPGLVVLVIAVLIAWKVVIRRGVFTWMRLAWAPAKAMARGDAEAAERAYQKALARARRFPALDHRRGLMLVELAGYAKNQGRYEEVHALFEECIEILAHNRRRWPMDYFIGLNNYAICFIHLRDHAAAQRMMEKVLDMTLAKRKGPLGEKIVAAGAVHEIELVLHLNLVFLYIEMHELDEATDHMDEADAIFVDLNNRRQARYGDHFRAIRALLMFALGRFADAASELAKARNTAYPGCLRVQAKLMLVRQNFAEAEQLLRRYFALEGKKGTVHRPDLRDHTLDLAESLFGQDKHDDAFAALQDARAIVADFALPADPAWKRTLETWSQRAQELGRTDTAASLTAELHKLAAAPVQAITISDRLRIRPLP